MNEQITDIVPSVATCKDMASWSEQKKADFVETFEKRSVAAQCIFQMVAAEIWEVARSRKFVSTKHEKTYQENVSNILPCRPSELEKVTGRSRPELMALAAERAKKILDQLPPLKKAVAIIDPETAKKIDQRDKLIVKGKAIRDQLVELREEITLDELDQNMTIAVFRKFLKDRKSKQRHLCVKLKDIVEEGSSLESQIDKALYRGLPGLSDAVLKVCADFHERATALSATTRRVAERVKFGDSETALELLQRFEQDEVEVSEEIKAEFGAALKKLKVAKLPTRGSRRKKASR